MWADYVSLFLLGFGMFLTNVTGNLNLKSSAKMKFRPIYYDPFVFLMILYADHNNLLDR